MSYLNEQSQEKIHEWTKAQVASASKPNYGKVFVTAPNLVRLLGDINDKTILELGCGNGYWLRLLSELGMARGHGIDQAPNQIESAKNWVDGPHNITYEVGDITKPLNLERDYDLVFTEHVLLEITTEQSLAEIFNNAAQALKEGGKLLVSDLHPFAPSSKPQNIRIPDGFNYFDNGATFEIASQRLDGETIFYKDCHWSLSALTNAITQAGFKITEIIEPLPSDLDIAKYPDQLGYRKDHPMAIMFVAQLSSV